MFFRASKPASEESPRSVGPNSRSSKVTPEAEIETAVETLASVFRMVARFPLGVADTEPEVVADICERWASHLLLRTAPPDPDVPAPVVENSDASGTTSKRPNGQEVRREWSPALKYLTTLRRTEHAQVTRTLGDLRQVIWAFVRSLNQALAGDSQSDGSVKEQLLRLQTAARQQSTEELRREALAVADTVAGLVEQRRKRHESQTTELGARVAALGAALEEAKREGTLDALTRLCNRRAFDDALQHTVDMAVFGQRMCLVLIDVDHFKVINDSHGHPAGDEVIRRVAECLVRTFRRRDDVVARYGGEEFAVILPDTTPKSAMLLTERLLASIRALSVPGRSGEIRCTASAGLTELGKNEPTQAWIERTDQALYEAKNSGRDRLVSTATE